MVSQDAESAAESPRAGLAGVQGLGGGYAGCADAGEGRGAARADRGSSISASFPKRVAVCSTMPKPVSITSLVPQRHQQYVRTSNLVERAFVEERRRTKVIPHLWDEGSLVKLVFGVLIRVSERWGKKCFSEFEQQQIRSLRAEAQAGRPRSEDTRTNNLSPNPAEVPRLLPNQFTGTGGLDRPSRRCGPDPRAPDRGRVGRGPPGHTTGSTPEYCPSHQ